MIQTLQHKNYKTALEIRSVFQASYAVEAKILKATNFPPLQRQLDNFTNCNNTFYGYFKNGNLAAVTEILHNNRTTHIQSLVVHPEYFRQGIAQRLINFVFETYNSTLISVETGADNSPACKLYEKMGFTETHKWMTEYNIAKVRYKKELPVSNICK